MNADALAMATALANGCCNQPEDHCAAALDLLSRLRDSEWCVVKLEKVTDWERPIQQDSEFVEGFPLYRIVEGVA